MKQRIAFAFGALGHSVFYVVLSTYFMIFVTTGMFEGVDKATSAKLIGIVTTVIVSMRVIEVFFDPLIGGLIDNGRSKFGKFKPWIVVGGLASSVLLILMFTNFFGLATHNTTLFIIVFAVAFFVMDCFYSAKDIAFWGMVPALSTDSEERESIATAGTFGASIGGNAVNITVVAVTTFFTYLITGKHTQGAAGWFWFAVLAAAIAGITSITTAMFTTEKDSAIRQSNERHGIKQILSAIITNDQLLWMSVAYVIYGIANVTTTAVLFYYFKYVMNRAGSFWIVGIIAGVLGFVIIPLFPWVSKLITRRWVFVGGVGIMLCSYLFFLFGGHSLVLVLIGLFLYYFPQQLVFLASLMTITDSVEYGQWKNGVRNEAVTLSLRPLLDKFSGALSNGLVGFIAVSAGMTGSATASSITSHGISMFNLLAFVVPALMMVVAIAVFYFKVTLTEKKHDEIVSELEAKLGAN